MKGVHWYPLHSLRAVLGDYVRHRPVLVRVLFGRGDMLNFIFNAFVSFGNSFGQFWAETSQFKKC